MELDLDIYPLLKFWKFPDSWVAVEKLCNSSRSNIKRKKQAKPINLMVSLWHSQKTIDSKSQKSFLCGSDSKGQTKQSLKKTKEKQRSDAASFFTPFGTLSFNETCVRIVCFLIGCGVTLKSELWKWGWSMRGVRVNLHRGWCFEADKRGADFVWMQISEPFFTWETTTNHRARKKRGIFLTWLMLLLQVHSWCINTYIYFLTITEYI